MTASDPYEVLYTYLYFDFLSIYFLASETNCVPGVDYLNDGTQNFLIPRCCGKGVGMCNAIWVIFSFISFGTRLLSFLAKWLRIVC